MMFQLLSSNAYGISHAYMHSCNAVACYPEHFGRTESKKSSRIEIDRESAAGTLVNLSAGTFPDFNLNKENCLKTMNKPVLSAATLAHL